MMTTDSELLTVQQLAEFLQVPVTTIYRWRQQGLAPPGIRVGRYVRFRRRDVEAFLEQRTSATS